MVTMGPITLLIPEPVFAMRAAGCGAALGTYLSAWDAPLAAMYADGTGTTGERWLVIALAPGGNQAVWVVDPTRGDLAAETALLPPTAARPVSQASLQGPILLAQSYWVGGPPPADAFGMPPQFRLPGALQRVADHFAHMGRAHTLTDVVDAYWRVPAPGE